MATGPVRWRSGIARVVGGIGAVVLFRLRQGYGSSPQSLSETG